MKRKEPSGYSVTSATAQGSRSHQEDRAVHEWIACEAGAGWLLAVFDGHRGDAAAEDASAALPGLFVEHLTKQRGDVPAALRDVFSALRELTQTHTAGSTASVLFIPIDAQTVTMAVLGDSPIAIMDSQGQSHIGPEHNVRTNLRERKAALARGGIYYGGYLEDSERPGIGLQMGRALGDIELARVLSRVPEIEQVPVGDKGIVVVGTDGLLSVGEDLTEQMVRVLILVQGGGEAEEVVEDALARETGDNVTAVVWRKD